MTYPPSGSAENQAYPPDRSYPAGPPQQQSGPSAYGPQPYSYAQPSSGTGSGATGYSPAGHVEPPGYAAGYGQPTGYGAAHGQPPGYGPPHGGYAQPGYHGHAPFTPPPMSPVQQVMTPPNRRTGVMVALVIGSVVLLLVLTGIGAALVLRSGPDSPAAPAAGNGQPAEYPARIELPEAVAGMSKVDDPRLRETADQVTADIRSSTPAETVNVAYYAPGGDLAKVVGVIGMTGRVRNPGTELEAVFRAMKVSDLETVDAGPLGGHMRCGDMSSITQQLTVCGWADKGSLGLGIFLDRTKVESAPLFRQIRGEVLKRG